MPGSRIPALTPLTAANSAGDDSFVVFDASTDATVRMARTAVAEALTADLPLQYYFGPRTTAPTARANGDALQAGDYYYSASGHTFVAYDGAAWAQYTASSSDFDALWDADGTAYVNAIGGATSAQRVIIDGLVRWLKLAGIWGKLDVLGVDLGISEAAALRDIRTPTRLATNNGATYVSGEGFLGNGSSAYVALNAATSVTLNYTQNAGSLAVWSTTDGNTSGRELGLDSAADAFLVARSSGGLAQARVNSSAALAEAVGDSLGLTGATRTSSSTLKLYKNGALIGTDTGNTSVAVPTASWTILRGSATYSPLRVWAWAVGGVLTDAEWETFYTILTAVRNGAVASSYYSIVLQMDRSRSMVQTQTITGGATEALQDPLVVDMRNGHIVNVTLTSDLFEIQVTNPPLGASLLQFNLTQDSTGGYEVTWPTAWKLEGGSSISPQPVPAPGYMTEIYARTYDGGQTFRLVMGAVWDDN